MLTLLWPRVPSITIQVEDLPVEQRIIMQRFLDSAMEDLKEPLDLCQEHDKHRLADMFVQGVVAGLF